MRLHLFVVIAACALLLACGASPPPGIGAADASTADASTADVSQADAASHTDAGSEAAKDAGCVPDDTADCTGKCGQIKNRCGNLASCGGCAAGKTCGGGGTPNVCGVGKCSPSCAGKACGANDGCGGICGQGSCGQGQHCVSGACRCDATSCSGCCNGSTCEPGDAGGSGGVCGCNPDCTGKACGADDGCGGSCATGSCGSGQYCAGGACACDTSSCTGCCAGSTCEPGTSDAECGQGGAVCTTCGPGTTCGSASCGGCGGNGQACCPGAACTSPLTCGGGGQSGTCGCTPQCAGQACGADDGCGGVCQTGSCASGLHCASGACTCDPTSCTGCCAAGQCMPGTSPSACGSKGGSCAICSAPTTTCATGAGGTNACGCGWTAETVQMGTAYLDDASMIVDQAGNLQIVFWNQEVGLNASGALVHAYRSNGAWATTTIAPNVNGYFTSLAADPSGRLHTVYLGQHYVFANGSWTSPDSYCAAGEDCTGTAAIAVGSDGTLYVAYYNNEGAPAVRYAVNSGAGWSWETVDTNGATYAPGDDGISIGLLPGNVPAIGYQSSLGIEFALRGAGGWSVEQVVSSPGDYSSISMEIDPATGTVRLLSEPGFGTQSYSERTNGTWSTRQLGGWGALPNGFPTPATIADVSYSGLNNPMPLELFTLSGGSVSAETITSTTANGTSVDAAILQGSGTSGTIWVLLGGYQYLVLYHRCASP